MRTSRLRADWQRPAQHELCQRRRAAAPDGAAYCEAVRKRAYISRRRAAASAHRASRRFGRRAHARASAVPVIGASTRTRRTPLSRVPRACSVRGASRVFRSPSDARSVPRGARQMPLAALRGRAERTPTPARARAGPAAGTSRLSARVAEASLREWESPLARRDKEAARSGAPTMCRTRYLGAPLGDNTAWRAPRARRPVATGAHDNHYAAAHRTSPRGGRRRGAAERARPWPRRASGDSRSAARLPAWPDRTGTRSRKIFNASVIADGPGPLRGPRGERRWQRAGGRAAALGALPRARHFSGRSLRARSRSRASSSGAPLVRVGRLAARGARSAEAASARAHAACNADTMFSSGRHDVHAMHCCRRATSAADLAQRHLWLTARRGSVIEAAAASTPVAADAYCCSRARRQIGQPSHKHQDTRYSRQQCCSF